MPYLLRFFGSLNYLASTAIASTHCLNTRNIVKAEFHLLTYTRIEDGGLVSDGSKQVNEPSHLNQEHSTTQDNQGLEQRQLGHIQ